MLHRLLATLALAYVFASAAPARPAQTTAMVDGRLPCSTSVTQASPATVAATTSCAPIPQPQASPPDRPAPPIPAAAIAAGDVNLTFGTLANFTPRTVDIQRTGAPGFQWYLPPSGVSHPTLNPDGSVTIVESANNANTGLQTYWSTGWRKSWRGFAVGGGAYFEATIAIPSPATIRTATGWPSWWTFPIEHLNQMNGQLPDDQWAGQPPGLEHWAEPDIMEKMDTGDVSYLGAAHDWYGHWRVPTAACTSPRTNHICGFQQAWPTPNRVPGGAVDFTRYHRYGLLWIPATATRPGSFTYFFDGEQVGPTTTWSLYTGQAPPIGLPSPWAFGVVDKEHMVLVLGAGLSPMQVKQVVVFQASPAADLRK